MRNDKYDPEFIKSLLIDDSKGAWDHVKPILLNVLKFLVIAAITVFGVSLFTGIMYAIGFLFSFWSAFVCMHLWNWFLVPTIGVAPIGFFYMMGVMVTFHAIKGYPANKEEKKEEHEGTWETLKAAGKPFVTYILCYAFALLSGWIIHTWFL